MASKPPPADPKKPRPFQKGRPLDFQHMPSVPRMRAVITPLVRRDSSAGVPAAMPPIVDDTTASPSTTRIEVERRPAVDLSKPPQRPPAVESKKPAKPTSDDDDDAPIIEASESASIDVDDDEADELAAIEAMITESATIDVEEEPPPSMPSVQAAPRERTPRDELVLRWVGIIDAVDYLALLKLPPPPSDAHPTDAEVRKAFHTFATAFHPDHYREAAHDVRVAATRIYNRGTEAYRVLADPAARRRYLKQLAETGQLRVNVEEHQAASATRGEAPKEPETIEALVRNAAGRPFAKKADQLLAAGDYKHARLQIQLAAMKEPENARLAARLGEVEAAIAAKKKGPA